MCIASQPKMTPPAPPPPAPPVPKRTDPEVKQANARNRQVAALAAGRDSTISTSPQGLESAASTAKKKLLGE